MVQLLAQVQIALSRHPDEAERAVRRVELRLQSDPMPAITHEPTLEQIQSPRSTAGTIRWDISRGT